METKYGLRLTTVPIHPSPTVLASAVRVAISPEKRSVIDRARQTVLRHYTADVMGKKWADYIMSIIGGDHANWMPFMRTARGRKIV